METSTQTTELDEVADPKMSIAQIALHPGNNVDEDGWVFDSQGEILGRLEPHAPFSINSVEAAEWLLRKIGQADAQVVAIEAERRAILANLAHKQRQQEARIKWFRERFGPELELFALSQLKGKSKTVTFTHGTASFRTNKGTNKILDQVLAVSWMRDSGYGDVVKVEESVTATNVVAAIKQLDLDPSSREVASFLESTGPQEKFSFGSGIGK